MATILDLAADARTKLEMECVLGPSGFMDGAREVAQAFNSFKSSAQLQEIVATSMADLDMRPVKEALCGLSLGLSPAMEAMKNSFAINRLQDSAASEILRTYKTGYAAVDQAMQQFKQEEEAAQVIKREFVESGLRSLGAWKTAIQPEVSMGLDATGFKESLAPTIRLREEWERLAAPELEWIQHQEEMERLLWATEQTVLLFKSEVRRLPHAVAAFALKLPYQAFQSLHELRSFLSLLLHWFKHNSPLSIFRRIRKRIHRLRSPLRAIEHGAIIRRTDQLVPPWHEMLLERQHGRRAPPCGPEMDESR